MARSCSFARTSAAKLMLLRGGRSSTEANAEVKGLIFVNRRVETWTENEISQVSRIFETRGVFHSFDVSVCWRCYCHKVSGYLLTTNLVDESCDRSLDLATTLLCQLPIINIQILSDQLQRASSVVDWASIWITDIRINPVAELLCMMVDFSARIAAQTRQRFKFVEIFLPFALRLFFSCLQSTVETVSTEGINEKRMSHKRRPSSAL